MSAHLGWPTSSNAGQFLLPEKQFRVLCLLGDPQESRVLGHLQIREQVVQSSEFLCRKLSSLVRVSLSFCLSLFLSSVYFLWGFETFQQKVLLSRQLIRLVSDSFINKHCLDHLPSNIMMAPFSLA